MAVIKVRWSVNELVNVMTQFDVQKVYRSTTTDTGPWVEITTVGTREPLVAGTTSYFFDDTTGETTYYYSVAYFHSTTLLESEKSDAMKGDLSGADFLTVNDLYLLVGSERVDRLFDDNVDGLISDNNAAVSRIISQAEGLAYSHMIRAYGSQQAIIDLANNDDYFKSQVAWIALEYASERRNEFSQNEGWGQWKAQFERAVKYLEKLASGRVRSKGETVAGLGANIGGTVEPRPATANGALFTFAPDRNNPSGGGGF